MQKLKSSLLFSLPTETTGRYPRGVMPNSRDPILFLRSGLRCQQSLTLHLRINWPRKYTSSQVIFNFLQCMRDHKQLNQKYKQWQLCSSYRDTILGVHWVKCSWPTQHWEARPSQQRPKGGGSTAERKRQSAALQWGKLLEVSFNKAINISILANRK